jgi:hypothetical protein
MYRIKGVLFAMLLVSTFIATLLSAITLVYFSYLYVWCNEDIDINKVTVTFYLTFGLALLTAALFTLAHVYKEELDASLRG